MKVKIIGTGSMYTKYNSACTLINENLIVDMPNGTVKQLLKMDEDVTKIKTILVTHMHGDYTADIPFFIKYVYNYAKIQTEINIIGPKGIKNKLIELFRAYNFETEEDIESYFKLNFIETLNDTIDINDYKIEALEVVHGLEKPSLGYVINDKLGLTGDSGLCESIEEIFRKSSLVVSDSSLIIGDEGHLGIDNLKYLINKYDKKVLATHLRDSTRAELIKENITNLIVVDDEYVINI